MGLLIAADPNSGKLVVLAPIQGGPADRAGIKPGDEVAPVTPLPALYCSACRISYFLPPVVQDVVLPRPNTSSRLLFCQTELQRDCCTLP